MRSNETPMCQGCPDSLCQEQFAIRMDKRTLSYFGIDLPLYSLPFLPLQTPSKATLFPRALQRECGHAESKLRNGCRQKHSKESPGRAHQEGETLRLCWGKQHRHPSQEIYTTTPVAPAKPNKSFPTSRGTNWWHKLESWR